MLTKKDVEFKCTGCGKCCQIEGICRISLKDVKNISKFLNLKEPEFLHQYTEVFDQNQIILKDHENTTDCIFLNEKKQCSIYPVRPMQCSTYPYWSEILESTETWNEEANQCEGIKKKNNFY
jgi:uncharacterized protein